MLINTNTKLAAEIKTTKQIHKQNKQKQNTKTKNKIETPIQR